MKNQIQVAEFVQMVWIRTLQTHHKCRFSEHLAAPYPSQDLPSGYFAFVIVGTEEDSHLIGMNSAFDVVPLVDV